MEAFLNPKTNTILRRIFGANNGCAISFIGSILPQFSPLNSIELLPNNIHGNALSFRSLIVRLLCEDGCGRRRVVEVWVARTEMFRLRVLFNIKRSRAALPLPLHIICLADFALYDSNDLGYRYHYSFKGDSIAQCPDGEDLTVIELPKFRMINPDAPTTAELWLGFLTGGVSDPAHLSACPETKTAFNLAKADAYSEDEINAFRMFDVELERRRQCIAHAQKDMSIVRKLYRI